MEIGSEACENTNDQTHQITNELVNSHEEPEALISNSGPHATTTLKGICFYQLMAGKSSVVKKMLIKD